MRNHQDLFDRLGMLRGANGETTVHVSFVEVRTCRYLLVHPGQPTQLFSFCVLAV
jgi:hypothetical protein